jgi:hypothetical protein
MLICVMLILVALRVWNKNCYPRPCLYVITIHHFLYVYRVYCEIIKRDCPLSFHDVVVVVVVVSPCCAFPAEEAIE